MAQLGATTSSQESTKPAWLSLIDNELYHDERTEAHGRKLLDVLKHLFEATGSDETLALEASRQMPSIFSDRPNRKIEFDVQRLTCFYIDMFEVLIFELASLLPFPSTEHSRIALFITDLKTLTDDMFGAPPGNSCLKALREALDCASKTAWGDASVAQQVHLIVKGDPAEHLQECSALLSLGTLFAKLYQADLLPRYGVMFISSEISEVFSLEGQKPLRSLYDDTAAAYKSELVAQDILLAGERLAREITHPGNPQDLTEEQWKAWIVGLENLAASTDQDPLGYKAHAREAHSKMLALLPN